MSLVRHACATTIYTMWEETKRIKRTVLGALMPPAVAFGVTFIVAQTVRLLGWVG